MTEWAFVPKNDDTIVSPPWLKFKPSDGILAPGERMTITATIFLSIELMGNLFPNYTSGPLVSNTCILDVFIFLQRNNLCNSLLILIFLCALSAVG